MAPPQASRDGPELVVSIAFLMDSSLALGTEYGRTFSEYVSPLLTRLHESYATHRSVCGLHRWSFDPSDRPSLVSVPTWSGVLCSPDNTTDATFVQSINRDSGSAPQGLTH